MPFIKRSNISYLTDNYENLYEQNAELINNINIPIKCIKMNLYKPERIIQNTKLLYQSILHTNLLVLNDKISKLQEKLNEKNKRIIRIIIYIHLNHKTAYIRFIIN
jgi:hypothetical protein